MKLRQIMIFVSGLTEAKKFYCEVLGFGLAEETKTRLTFEPGAPSENDQGRYAAFADPSGNVHEIWEPRVAS